MKHALARICLSTALLTSLAGCVVAPSRGYYAEPYGYGYAPTGGYYDGGYYGGGYYGSGIVIGGGWNGHRDDDHGGRPPGGPGFHGGPGGEHTGGPGGNHPGGPGGSHPGGPGGGHAGGAGGGQGGGHGGGGGGSGGGSHPQ